MPIWGLRAQQAVPLRSNRKTLLAIALKYKAGTEARPTEDFHKL
jgi:hypothetical protein